MATKKKAFVLNSTLYEVLRWFTWIVLPAIATLLASLNSLWNWNLPIDAILSTFAAIETFIGVVLGLAKYSNDTAISSKSSKK